MVTTTLLADEGFELLRKKEMIIEAKRDMMPEAKLKEIEQSDLNDLNDLNDQTTTELDPVFEAIDGSKNLRDGLRYIAGVVAQKKNYLGLNLGSKEAQSADESPSRFTEMVNSGLLKSINFCSKYVFE